MQKPAPELTPVADETGSTPAGTASVINANSQFALEVYSRLKPGEDNIFFSPYSISTTLAMVYEGARGKTASEIQSVFHFPADGEIRRPSYAAVYNQINAKDARYQLSNANALWAQKDYKFLDEYLNAVNQYYGGRALNVDFVNAHEEARQEINKWVEDKTRDKIKGLLPPDSVNKLTRLVLTNTVYFKGKWVKQFNQDETRDDDFRVGSGNKVKTPMMRITGEEAKFNYAETGDLQALEMPYEGDRLSMVILLPKKDDLPAVERSLSPAGINEIRSKFTEQRVDVFMPKFTFDTKYLKMGDMLAAMGMPTAFIDGAADFSGMDGSRQLFIDVVVHQAFVDVNEEGTEAAAATGVEMEIVVRRMGPVKTFRADHPFIFMIQEKGGGNILFLGRVANPVK